MSERKARLAEARRHVAEGEQRVNDQLARIAELRKDGHNTAEAERLLSTLRESLQAMRDHLAFEQSEADKAAAASRLPDAP